MILGKMDRKAQATIFVIVAIVLVGAIVLIFAFRDSLFFGVPAEFRPVYDYYSECVRQETENGLSILGSQGGRIDTGEYVPGSDFAPFSSHLSFVGQDIPYWYSLAGNNVVREDVPSKSDMERELDGFLETRLGACDFSSFYEQGFYVELEEASVETTISDNTVNVNVNSNLIVSREDRSARKSTHRLQVNSKLGELYNNARDIYDKERNDAFLEDYAIDVLRLNAPVDGVEVTCSPQIWKTKEVVDGLRTELENNIAALKFEGDYYDLASQDDEYFVVNTRVSQPTRVLYSQNWPSRVEVTPADQNLMIAEPIGNQQGLGILGFCYVPYHFVYDVSFPVLIQVSDGFEIFQFPLVVIIDNNLPRKADIGELTEEENFDVCQFREGQAEIRTFDEQLQPIEADISYQCFENSCGLGKTELEGNSAILNTDLPVCVNGQIIAKAEGYAEKRQFYSSNSETSADIILEREYEVVVEIRKNGQIVEGTTVAHFTSDVNTSDEKTVSAVLPETDRIKLTEGTYNVNVFSYGNSSVVIPGTTKRECVEVPVSGILGALGSTKEHCVSIEVPETRIDYALTGGGKTSTYILASELESGRIIIDISELPIPNSLEQLQYNYEVFNSLGVELSFG